MKICIFGAGLTGFVAGHRLSAPRMSKEELLAFCDLARKEYYMRAGYIIPKIFQSIRNPQEGIRTLKSAKTFFRHLK